jgi:hypothetical protein
MRHLLVALLVPVSVLAGCPGSLDDPARFDAELGIDDGGRDGAGGGRDGAGGGGGGAGGGCPSPPPSFGTTCSVSGCHAATAPAGGLDLASPNIVMRLSGKKAMGGPGLLIDPTTPAASVLYTKLTPTPPFGARMPLVGAPLSDADIACVLSWIESSTK